jgi:TM2 domain-containing membrane protein YozV
MEFCQSCGQQVSPEAPYCPSCGTSLRRTTSYYSSRQPYTVGSVYAVPRKNPMIALSLGLILGFFGLWGFGQVYAGRVGKGIGFFLIGAIIGGLFWLSVILTVILIGYVGMVIFGILFVGGWLWQAFDAYNSAQEFNEIYAQPVRAQW